MSIRYRNNNGQEVMVGGSVPSGDVEYGASAVKSGTVTNTSAIGQTAVTQTITFAENMPDADYIVEVQCSAPINHAVTAKTVSGFTLSLYAPEDFGTIAVDELTIKYEAFVLFEIAGAIEMRSEIDTLTSYVPTSTTVTNKLMNTSQVNSALATKQNTPTVLSQNLAIGETSVTFTGIPTTGNYLVDFFTSTGINASSLDVTTTPGTAVLTFKAQTEVVTVFCKIEEVAS